MMDVRAIRTEADYAWALAQIEAYFDNVPAPGTPEADRFDVLSALIKEYEERQTPIPAADPVDVLHFAIASLGRTQAELGHLIGRSRATEVLNRRRRLTLDMIRDISRAWNIPIAALAGAYALRRESA